MEKLKEKILAIVAQLFGVADAVCEFAKVPENVPGDYSTNVAMRIAKVAGKAPREVAEMIIAELEKTESFGFSMAGPGFINVEIKAKALHDELAAQWSANYGDNTSGAGKTAIVEFPSTNIAKPYSVGHLRPGTQGWAIKQILQANGWTVITDNHLGDTGTPFGVWAVGFKRSGIALDAVTIYDLGQIYIDTKKALKDEEAAGETTLKDEVQDWLLKLEAGEPEATALSERFTEISLKHTHEIMARLGIETDFELGEKFYVKQGKELVQKYLAAGVFEQNADGSVICRLDEAGIDVPMLVLKSNGAALYSTNDLACAVYREERWSPDKVFYCVGAEQKFYFEQLFAMNRKIGLKQNDVHIWHGTIDQVGEDGKREKMSSRKGVVLMEELLNDAEQRVRENFADETIDKADIKRVAVGAIKFSDFMADRKTGILYDPEKIFALTGFSGPFCQYAAVRLKRILEKNADFERVDFASYDYEAEKELLQILLRFPELVRMIGETMESHKIAAYCFELAQALNRYYEQTPIAKAEPVERSARLDLAEKTLQVMARALDLLGIEIPEKM